jgi:hypothetical protein
MSESIDLPIVQAMQKACEALTQAAKTVSEVTGCEDSEPISLHELIVYLEDSRRLIDKLNLLVYLTGQTFTAFKTKAATIPEWDDLDEKAKAKLVQANMHVEYAMKNTTDTFQIMCRAESALWAALTRLKTPKDDVED